MLGKLEYGEGLLTLYSYKEHKCGTSRWLVDLLSYLFIKKELNQESYIWISGLKMSGPMIFVV